MERKEQEALPSVEYEPNEKSPLIDKPNRRNMYRRQIFEPRER